MCSRPTAAGANTPWVRTRFTPPGSSNEARRSRNTAGSKVTPVVPFLHGRLKRIWTRPSSSSDIRSRHTPGRGVADEVFTPPNIARLDQHPSVNLDPVMVSDPPPLPGRCTLCLGQSPLVGLPKAFELIQRRGIRALLVLPLPPPPGTRPHQPFEDLPGDLLELAATQVARVHEARDLILSGDPHPLWNDDVKVHEQAQVAREGLEERDEPRPAIVGVGAASKTGPHRTRHHRQGATQQVRFPSQQPRKRLR
jgi:hypothetical protein